MYATVFADWSCWVFCLTLPPLTCDHTLANIEFHCCRLGGNEAPGHVCHVLSAKLCWCLGARDGDWSCIANESGGLWQCSKLLQDWLKVFRVGGAACGCSVGTGNPWQTLPLLLSALMESEESLEVASVSSTPPQKQTLSFSTSMPRLLTLHPPGATPILSWSLFISSLWAQGVATCK